MPDYSDKSPEATRIAAEQQQRLRRLRVALTPNQAEAARASGVGKDAWNKMEMGRTRVNAVALARFCGAYGLPTEYVMTGAFTGLPDGLVRQLVDLERLEEAERREVASEGGTSAPLRCGTSGNPSAKYRDGRRKRPAEPQVQ